MPDKPEYQFRFQIVDKTTGEVVESDYTYMTGIGQFGDCDSVEIHVSSMLRAFERSSRTKYERENYAPAESEEAA